MEDWNPMLEASDSFRNTMSFTISENMEDIPCPFQKEANTKCFKGIKCLHKHGPYTPEVLQSHPKLARNVPKSEINLIEFLPTHSFPPDSFLTQAWVTAASHPWEFFVVLKENSNCLCGTRLDFSNANGSKELSYPPILSDGFNDLNILWSNMQKHYALRENCEQNVNVQYFMNEVVAVRLTLSGAGGGRGWFRAVVLEDTENDLDKIPNALLQLLDYGISVVKSVMDIVPLHERFTQEPPMAYKCSLYGISPMLGEWGKKAVEFFKQAVTSEVVLLQVKDQEDHEDDVTFERTLKVSLYAKADGKLFNVAHKMCDKGLGIEWNCLPTRPAGHAIVGRKYEYLLKRVKTEDDKEHIICEMEKTMRRLKLTK